MQRHDESQSGMSNSPTHEKSSGIIHNESEDDIYGYVFFRQKKDSSIQRGYLQKSVVLLSHRLLPRLYEKILNTIAPTFFQMDIALLESTYINRLSWPEYREGEKYELPVMGIVIHYEIPSRNGSTSASSGPNTPYIKSISDSPSALLSQVAQYPLEEKVSFRLFRKVISNMWSLWEIVLTCQPLLVVSDSPSVSSEAVVTLTKLIHPLKFGGDFRTYFTINDPDFKTFSEKHDEDIIPPAIIGVSNPYFLKVFQNWTNTLSLSVELGGNKVNSLSSLLAYSRDHMIPSTTSFGTADIHNHFISKSKPLVDEDKQISRSFIKAKFSYLSKNEIEDVCQKNDDLLLSHFYKMTTDFIKPLDDFFNTLIPSYESIVDPSQQPRLRKFDPEAFLATLSPNTPFSIFDAFNNGKKQRSELYRKFFLTPTWERWLEAREKSTQIELLTIRIDGLHSMDMHRFMKNKTPFQMIDFYLHLNSLLTTLEGKMPRVKQPPVPEIVSDSQEWIDPLGAVSGDVGVVGKAEKKSQEEASRDKLKETIRNVICCLPEEIQRSIEANRM
eukprot:TRINITY_DN5252_c0_g1_i1.p1 TRINITY_DN5252_c0_g1~~TRINITY_DN5252_c0_g1_i1.p1  ORF type:complete len:620 (+),score=174.32 TRINITY_DN5252_c0_g1_i1:193-1860(+)